MNEVVISYAVVSEMTSISMEIVVIRYKVKSLKYNGVW
jgi:hypothetical protein